MKIRKTRIILSFFVGVVLSLVLSWRYKGETVVTKVPRDPVNSGVIRMPVHNLNKRLNHIHESSPLQVSPLQSTIPRDYDAANKVDVRASQSLNHDGQSNLPSVKGHKVVDTNGKVVETGGSSKAKLWNPLDFGFSDLFNKMDEFLNLGRASPTVKAQTYPECIQVRGTGTRNKVGQPADVTNNRQNKLNIKTAKSNLIESFEAHSSSKGSNTLNEMMNQPSNKAGDRVHLRDNLNKPTEALNGGISEEQEFIARFNTEKKDSQKKVPPEIESEKEFLQRMYEVQQKRHTLLYRKCKEKYGLSLLDYQRDRDKILKWKDSFEHAYANDDHQFIICRVLKVGSLSWRNVMISLYEKGSTKFRRAQAQGDKPMSKFDDDAFMSKLQRYRKALFVREPFARFLSAYRDKYVELRHFSYYKPLGMKIINQFRKNATPLDLSDGIPTFEEFTRWVIQNEGPEGDFHWRPLFNWYHPCEIPYDYIGKLETGAEDTKYIFQMTGIDRIETYPSTETHHSFSSNADVLKEFYSQLSPDLLPELIERYREEFELFDYPIPQKISDIWTQTWTP